MPSKLQALIDAVKDDEYPYIGGASTKAVIDRAILKVAREYVESLNGRTDPLPRM